MIAAERQLWTIAALAGGALLLFPELAGWFTRGVVRGAGSVVVNAATGTVVGIGEAIGIPATDANECEAALAAGQYWEASFYCPAGTFLKSAAGAVYDAATGAIVGEAEPSASAEVIVMRPASDVLQQWYAATGGVLRPGQTQSEAIAEWQQSMML